MRRGAEEEEMEGKIKAAKKPLRKVGGGGNVDLNGTQKVSHGTRRQTHAHTQYTHAHIHTRHTDSQRDDGQMDGQLFKLRSFIPLRWARLSELYVHTCLCVCMRVYVCVSVSLYLAATCQCICEIHASICVIVMSPEENYFCHPSSSSSERGGREAWPSGRGSEICANSIYSVYTALNPFRSEGPKPFSSLSSAS